MNLESTVKFHFPKSTQISDSPRATDTESLTGTDIMAGMGMVQQRAKLGFSAFLGKMGVSSNDRERAIELLTEYALSTCDKVAALRKLDSDIKLQVMQALASFAYEDYCRSAASTRVCDCCHGEKFINAEVFTNKISRPSKLPEGLQPKCQVNANGEMKREVRESVRVLCHKCKGKGRISNACQCKGRGVVLDKEKTLLNNGVPVHKTCPRCDGRKYARLSSENVRRAISILGIEITQPTWSRHWKPFCESLIDKLNQEESFAERQLSRVTK